MMSLQMRWLAMKHQVDIFSIVVGKYDLRRGPRGGWEGGRIVKLLLTIQSGANQGSCVFQHGPA